MDVIKVEMTVAKVQTLSDGGIRVTLDMAESETMQMAQFTECKRFGAILMAQFTPRIDEPKTPPDTVGWEGFTLEFPDPAFPALPVARHPAGG